MMIYNYIISDLYLLVQNTNRIPLSNQKTESTKHQKNLKAIKIFPSEIRIP